MLNQTHLKNVVLVGWMLFFLGATATGASTWHVDDNNCPGPGSGTPGNPFCSIQAGIDASINGDEVLVSAGTYNETINFNGKAIRLRSSNGPEVTTIDATGLNGTVVRCVSGEGPDTILQGFTITGGLAFEGGGMLNVNSTPTVTNCIFFGNVASAPNPLGDGSGGGMYNVSSSPTVNNCVFRQNKSIGWGGGGGMFNTFSANPTIANCTFFENDAISGGGMLNSGNSNPIVSNCILWGNVDGSGVGELAQIRGTAVVNYSCVQGAWTGAGGVGNIDTDPLFVDPDGPDDILGTKDDNLRLLPGSPAIDAGDNTLVTVANDLDGNPRFADDPDTTDTGNGVPPIVDMGAYEFQGTTIPTLSEWGLIVMGILLVTMGTICLRRRAYFYLRPGREGSRPPPVSSISVSPESGGTIGSSPARVSARLRRKKIKSLICWKRMSMASAKNCAPIGVGLEVSIMVVGARKELAATIARPIPARTILPGDRKATAPLPAFSRAVLPGIASCAWADTQMNNTNKPKIPVTLC